MPVTLEEIPRNGDGVVDALFRLRHRDESFTFGYGNVVFENGATVKPITGRELERIVGAMGNDLTLEPWTGPINDEAPAPRRRTVVPQRPLTRVPLPPELREAPLPAAPAPCASQVSQAPRAPQAPQQPLPPPAPVIRAGADDLPHDVDALTSIAAARGIKVEQGWGARAIRKAIRRQERGA